MKRILPFGVSKISLEQVRVSQYRISESGNMMGEKSARITEFKYAPHGIKEADWDFDLNFLNVVGTIAQFYLK